MTSEPRPPAAPRDGRPSASGPDRPATHGIPMASGVPVTSMTSRAPAIPRAPVIPASPVIALNSARPASAIRPAPTRRSSVPPVPASASPVGPSVPRSPASASPVHPCAAPCPPASGSPVRAPAARPPSVRPGAGLRPRTRGFVRGLPAVAAVFGLASCGVSTTGVIEAGEAATAPSATVNVYLVRDGQVVAVPWQTPGNPGVTAAVTLLFDGPTAAYAAKGYRSDLPRLTAPPRIQFGNGLAATVMLPDTPAPLRSTALRQVVCTTADALRRTSPGALQLLVPHSPTSLGGTTVPAAAPPILVTVTTPSWSRIGSSYDCP